jgi:hypothetical protein
VSWSSTHGHCSSNSDVVFAAERGADLVVAIPCEQRVTEHLADLGQHRVLSNLWLGESEPLPPPRTPPEHAMLDRDSAPLTSRHRPPQLGATRPGRRLEFDLPASATSQNVNTAGR